MAAQRNLTYIVVPLVSLAGLAGYFWYAKPRASSALRAPAQTVDAFAGRDGRKEAEALLAAGKLVLIETGAAVSWDAERREIAAANYGLELRRIEETGGEGFARYVDAFNRVMRPQIVARHGRGVFDDLHREAIALQETRGRAPQDTR